MLYISKTKSVKGSTQVTRSSQTLKENGFVFSTEDFTRCFTSPEGRYLNTDLYINIKNQTHGHFHFEGKSSASKAHRRRCNIGIIVPTNMILSFELVNLDFPCGMGAVRIYQSTNTKADLEAGAFCGHSSDEDASSKLIVPVHVAVVVVSMYRFSTKHEVHLKFSAISLSERPQLEHINISISQGLILRFLSLLY